MRVIKGKLRARNGFEPIIELMYPVPGVVVSTEYQSKGQYHIRFSSSIEGSFWYQLSGVPFGRITYYGMDDLFLEVFTIDTNGLISTDQWGEMYFEFTFT